MPQVEHPTIFQRTDLPSTKDTHFEPVAWREYAKDCIVKHGKDLSKATTELRRQLPGAVQKARRFVERWTAMYREQGVHKPHRPGRPKKLSDEQALKAAKLFAKGYKQLHVHSPCQQQKSRAAENLQGSRSQSQTALSQDETSNAHTEDAQHDIQSASGSEAETAMTPVLRPACSHQPRESAARSRWKKN